MTNPKYPIYIISKGRAYNRLTVKALDKMSVPYRVVIEPQEFDEYASVIDPSRLLTLPFSNLGQGSIPARNWVWAHSIAEGHARHWILDDNIKAFWRYNNNTRLKVYTGSTFAACEDFTDRHTNIGVSGMEYFMFIPNKTKCQPYRINTRVYSIILLNNSLPFRWRGRYNEDTDLSIRILKAGYCSILFQAFLAEKSVTMTMKGGNTDELYKQDDSVDGRLLMAQSLQEQHPEMVKITRLWGRWQHDVDYRSVKRNKLIKRDDLTEFQPINNYDMVLVNRDKYMESIK